MSDKSSSPIAGSRKLTAILCADVHGYSRLMSCDEEGTFKNLIVCREIIFRVIREHRGRVANTAGDAVLAEFISAKDAVDGAMEIQRSLFGFNQKLSPDCQMQFRIGINLGDVYEQQGDLFGDGVNIAARIQSLAEPGGILLSASVYEQLEHKSETKVELLGDQKVKNIEKPVRVYRVKIDTVLPEGPSHSVSLPSPAIPEVTPPSITVGVLAFDDLSEDPEQGYFCDGLTEDLTTALAAIPELKIVARNTMFGFKGKSPDIRQLGRDIGATHIIEGSIRKAGSRIRINVQLLETNTGGHIWAHRYDKELSDLFEIQDDIVTSVVTEMDVRLVSGEQARAHRATAKNVDAYDLYMRARSVASIFSPRTFASALALLDRALELDSDFVSAYTKKAVILILQAQNGMSANPDDDVRQARFACDRIIQLKPDSSYAHAVQGSILHYDRKLEQAQKEFELSISLSPNSAEIYMGYGYVCLQIGAYQKALSAARHAKELSPTPVMINIELEALSLQLLGRSEEALVIIKRGSALEPRDLFLWVTFAGLVAPMGLREECALARQKILEIQPNFDSVRYSTSTGMFDAETAKKYAEMLHMVGLP